MNCNCVSQLLPRCMEVHCLQCKNCQYRYLWQYPSEMSNFFFLTSIYQTGWLPKQFIIVWSPYHLVLIPGGGGFYYWRDACSTIAMHCNALPESRFEGVVKIGPPAKSQPSVGTSWNFLDIDLTPKYTFLPKKPAQEPPQKRISLLCSIHAMKWPLVTAVYDNISYSNILYGWSRW